MSKNRPADVKYGDGSIRVRERKDGGISYQARWFDGLQWRAKTFHGSIEQAEDFLRLRGREIRTGRYVADEDVTLLEAVNDYIHRGRSRWRTSTYAAYITIRDMLAKHQLSKTRLSEITPRQCQLWIDAMAKDYSASRMTVIRAVLNGALREALRLGVIHNNPMNGVRLPSQKKRDYDIWTPEQAKRAIAESVGKPILHVYYTLALTTGMRPGELRALTWDNVNLADGTITVAHTITRNEAYTPVLGTTTKSGRTRTIAISDGVVETLRAHRRTQVERQLKAEHWSPMTFVLDRGNGNFMPQQTFAKAHKRFCESVGLPVCRLHDLRHAAATMLFQAGVPIKVVSEILGHKSVTITMDIYAHVTETHKREVADTMAAVLNLERKV